MTLPLKEKQDLISKTFKVVRAPPFTILAHCVARFISQSELWPTKIRKLQKKRKEERVRKQERKKERKGNRKRR